MWCDKGGSAPQAQRGGNRPVEMLCAHRQSKAKLLTGECESSQVEEGQEEKQEEERETGRGQEETAAIGFAV